MDSRMTFGISLALVGGFVMGLWATTGHRDRIDRDCQAWQKINAEDTRPTGMTVVDIGRDIQDPKTEIVVYTDHKTGQRFLCTLESGKAATIESLTPVYTAEAK
jgi:hypothetical protein